MATRRRVVVVLGTGLIQTPKSPSDANLFLASCRTPQEATKRVPPIAQTALFPRFSEGQASSWPSSGEFCKSLSFFRFDMPHHSATCRLSANIWSGHVAYGKTESVRTFMDRPTAAPNLVPWPASIAVPYCLAPVP